MRDINIHKRYNKNKLKHRSFKQDIIINHFEKCVNELLSYYKYKIISSILLNTMLLKLCKTLEIYSYDVMNTEYI